MVAMLAAGCHAFQCASPRRALLRVERVETMMDAKWSPRRKPYTPDWIRKKDSSNVYGEQQNEYAKYAEQQNANSPTPPPSAPTSHVGKGFGGGEATRDPEPTEYDPNDPKGKQQAIHKAESFAEYLAKRSSTP